MVGSLCIELIILPYLAIYQNKKVNFSYLKPKSKTDSITVSSITVGKELYSNWKQTAFVLKDLNSWFHTFNS